MDRTIIPMRSSISISREINLVVPLEMKFLSTCRYEIDCFNRSQSWRQELLKQNQQHDQKNQRKSYTSTTEH